MSIVVENRQFDREFIGVLFVAELIGSVRRLLPATCLAERLLGDN